MKRSTTPLHEDDGDASYQAEIMESERLLGVFDGSGSSSSNNASRRAIAEQGAIDGFAHISSSSCSSSERDAYDEKPWTTPLSTARSSSSTCSPSRSASASASPTILAWLRQSRRRILVISVGIFVLVFTISSFSFAPAHDPSRSESLWSWYQTATGSSAGGCPDPYALPGFFHHDERTPLGRWLPYTRDTFMQGDHEMTSGNSPAPRGSHPDAIPLQALDALPSLTTSLADLAKRRDDPALAFLRGRAVFILGCSIDRQFLEGFCRRHKGEYTNPVDDWHGLFVCRFEDLDFEIQLWFTYGAIFPAPTNASSLPPGKESKHFETQITELWPKKIAKLNRQIQQRLDDGAGEPGLTGSTALYKTAPSLVIFSGSIWDILEYRAGLRRSAKSSKRPWEETPLTWEQLRWHRMRLLEMRSAAVEAFSTNAVMYRPPTYFAKQSIPSSNGYLEGIRQVSQLDALQESVLRVHESAKALNYHYGDDRFPLFRWAEKLIGHDQYSDTMHLSPSSNAHTLYGDMLLYYLRYYTNPNPTHCL